MNVPAYDWWSEALHGVAVDGTTEFSEPIGLAATFDTPRIHEMATVIGVEGRLKHAQDERAGHSNIFEGLDFRAPNINIFAIRAGDLARKLMAKIHSLALA